MCDNTSVSQDSPVLTVRDLTVAYKTEKGNLPTVRHVSLSIGPGEIYGLVGESGSGKTTLARGIVRYLPENGRVTSGSVCLDGTDLLGLPAARMRSIWGARITMVHQDPAAAVNPSIRIGEQIAEVARLHLGMSAAQARAKALEMLTKVHMADPERVARCYGHQLSGGQLQRVLIAIALTTNPRLLIMDEPTTALDVTTEAVILDLVRELLAEYNTAVLYITHNLGVVARICHRVGVMYAGELTEEGAIRQVFKGMLHPYTLALLGCVPRVDVDKRDVVLSTIPGYIPRPDRLPPGCIFAPRCPGAEDACAAARPPLVEGEPGHKTACRRWEAVVADPAQFVRQRAARDYSERVEGPVILEASHVVKHFKLPASPWRRAGVVRAVDDVSVRVRGSFTMGIVGESGCGKTTFVRCIAGLEQADAGEIELEGQKLPYAVERRPHAQLKKLQMVFQNPDASLNPQFTVGESVGRPLAQSGNVPRPEIEQRVRELFRAVNLPEDYINRLPHELSGGEKQRVAIARAFASDPALMICDEPISSLDVSVQASLMNLLVRLQEERKTSYLFISHDLAAVRHLADWIAVVYLGRLCEIGAAEDVFAPPLHPYTEALLSALPIPDPDAEQNPIRLEGSVPSAVNIPAGCRFHTRCPRKLGAICEEQEPPWQEGQDSHQICCHIPLTELCTLQNSRQALQPAAARGGGE